MLALQRKQPGRFRRSPGIHADGRPAMPSGHELERLGTLLPSLRRIRRRAGHSLIRRSSLSRSYHERIGRSLPRRRRLRRGGGGLGAAGGFDGGVFGPLLAERAGRACGWWRGPERGGRRFGGGHRPGDGRGRRGDLLDQGRVELIDPRDEDLVADVQAVEVGDGFLLAAQRALPYRLDL